MTGDLTDAGADAESTLPAARRRGGGRGGGEEGEGRRTRRGLVVAVLRLLGVILKASSSYGTVSRRARGEEI